MLRPFSTCKSTYFMPIHVLLLLISLQPIFIGCRKNRNFVALIIMRTFFVLVKRILQGTIITLVALYALLYVLLSIPAIQGKVRDVGQHTLSQYLGVPLKIARVEISPFNKVELFGVLLPDQRGDTLLYAHKIAAGIDLWELPGGKIDLSNIQLFGLDLRVVRDSADAPTNLQFVIDAFVDTTREKSDPALNLAIQSAVIRRSSMRYDVLSAPRQPQGVFDANHVAVTDLLATMSLKAFNKDSVNIYIKRLSGKEQSGFNLDRLTLRVEGNRRCIAASHFSVQTGGTHLHTDTATILFPASAGGIALTDSTRLLFAMNDAVVVPSDFAPLLPALRHFDMPVSFTCMVGGTLDDLHVRDISAICGDNVARLGMEFTVRHALQSDSLSVACPSMMLTIREGGLSALARNLNVTDARTLQMLDTLGNVAIEGSSVGRMPLFEGDIRLHTAAGDMQVDGTVLRSDDKQSFVFKGDMFTDGVDLAKVMGENSQWGMVAFDLHADCNLYPDAPPAGHLSGHIGRFDYKGYSYENVKLDAAYARRMVSGKVAIDDPNARVAVEGRTRINGRSTLADLRIVCDGIAFDKLHLSDAYPGYRLSFSLDAAYTGNRLDNANGYISVDSLLFTDGDSHFAWNRFRIAARNDTLPQRIVVESDYINGEVTGHYTFSSLGRSLRNMVAALLPTAVPPEPSNSRRRNRSVQDNDIEWHFVITPHVEMAQILRLPFTITDRTRIDGYIRDLEQTARLNMDIPNMWVGSKHIEDAAVYINRRGDKLDYSLQAGYINKKKISTMWSVRGGVEHDNVKVGIHWNTNTAATYCGAISLDSRIMPCPVRPEGVDLSVTVQPTQFVINDTVWDIKPAHILLHDKNIIVDRLELSRPSQHIYIEGVASENPADTMHIDLRDINLDYIFETLNINYVTFGGRATGRVDAANLFSKTPYLATNGLDVRNFSYNHAVFGDISLLSMWNPDNKGILLKGIITGKEQNESYVDGYIFPTLDSLSIDFNVDRVPLSFIRPFVGNILSDVDGTASGQVTLGGNFKRIFLTGDAYAHDFSFGVPFINTRYYVTDSVHFTKESIWFRNIAVGDGRGNMAHADGILRHRYFANLSYDIDIHDAVDLLVFNIPPTPGASFYGTVYGTGGVAIKGDDFHTDISVNMLTEDNSEFAFVLTNTANAADYSFLTFTDSSAEAAKSRRQVVAEVDSTVIRNNMMMEKHTAAPKPKNVLYLTVQADITPQADITLVMDEVLGDKMEATGEGNIRVEYNTGEDDFKMYGSYTVGNGSYNFSLQDIITRDFSITSGSTVSFRGSPLDAILDINAVYSLQANLADLDESFVTEGELTRTTVPIHTILKISGNLTRPDIAFDIELPTVSADIDSKMRSIISTDEMMNRQIIYLLALNRFFTPDYNTGQNGNNEWVSMASSTISSSLGSILGQISDNWNISPNFRSDKGDFSDMEVDLVLSSQLLNNRLIFNGNFGYRDKRYNSTNFVGDFDIEYLLTESGNLRLKGYNHFNDRNYSMRTALTTQGIGIMYTHDFDSWLKFFDRSSKSKKRDKKRKGDSAATKSQPTDTVPSVPADTTRVVTAMPAAVEPQSIDTVSSTPADTAREVTAIPVAIKP